MIPMKPLNLHPIQEIYHLWEPVYPYLGQQIHELYHRQSGNILEIGPFSGVIFSLQKRKIGSSFSIAAFPFGMHTFFREEARRRKVEDKIKVIETNPALTGVEENKIDLAIFRGAFFFPSLFKVNFSAIYGILRIKGMALIGGGFGKFTPEAVIERIRRRSRDLNLKIGKVEVNEDQLRREIRKGHVEGKVEIVSEGGLWLLMRK